MATDKKQTGLRLPEDLMNDIKEIAEKERRTITNTVIIGLEKFIEQWKSEHKYMLVDLDKQSAKVGKK